MTVKEARDIAMDLIYDGWRSCDREQYMRSCDEAGKYEFSPREIVQIFAVMREVEAHICREAGRAGRAHDTGSLAPQLPKGLKRD